MAVTASHHNLPLHELVVDENNPNEMSEAQMKALCENIKEYGFLIPVITNRNFKVADGHQRLEAAKRLGMTTVPVIALDIEEPDRLILQQVMNKLKGQHREERDAKAFKALYEAEQLNRLATMLGVKENRLLSVMEKHNEERLKGDLDAIPPIRMGLKVSFGDVWTLGNHRIVCGDSTEPETYTKLMQGELADAVFTDPPYGVSYKGDNNPNGKDWGVMANDGLRADELELFLKQAFANMYLHAKTTAPAYIFYASSNHIRFENALNVVGWRVKQQIIWDKGLVLGHSDYHWAHEPCLYCAKNGYNSTWFGDRTQTTMFSTMSIPQLQNLSKDELVNILASIHQESTVWQERRDNARDYQHATQKPVSLAKRALKNSTRPGSIVLEPFSGSGSTLIACEAIGRHCRAIEFEPKHVATAITRWEKLTGLKAVKA